MKLNKAQREFMVAGIAKGVRLALQDGLEALDQDIAEAEADLSEARIVRDAMLAANACAGRPLTH